MKKVTIEKEIDLKEMPKCCEECKYCSKGTYCKLMNKPIKNAKTLQDVCPLKQVDFKEKEEKVKVITINQLDFADALCEFTAKVLNIITDYDPTKSIKLLVEATHYSVKVHNNLFKTNKEIQINSSQMIALLAKTTNDLVKLSDKIIDRKVEEGKIVTLAGVAATMIITKLFYEGDKSCQK